LDSLQTVTIETESQIPEAEIITATTSEMPSNVQAEVKQQPTGQEQENKQETEPFFAPPLLEKSGRKKAQRREKGGSKINRKRREEE
jgi:hypothetical protein